MSLCTFVLIIINYIRGNLMGRAIISISGIKAENLVKEAKKKAIDHGLTFSEVALLLLGKWVSGDVSVEKEVKK